MKKLFLFCSLILFAPRARADFWGGDIPLLVEIVFNTLHTMLELEEQSQLLKDEMAGIKDRIHRIRTIKELIKPDDWAGWKDPGEAMRRLRSIYYTLPKEYRTKKSDNEEKEMAQAMNMISRTSGEAQSSFNSGKELERRGADASPGVAQKLTASGVGTLISMEAQTQIILSHITSLITQLLADANDRESRGIVSKGNAFSGISESIGQDDGKFSSKIFPLRMKP